MSVQLQNKFTIMDFCPLKAVVYDHNFEVIYSNQQNNPNWQDHFHAPSASQVADAFLNDQGVLADEGVNISRTIIVTSNGTTSCITTWALTIIYEEDSLPQIIGFGVDSSVEQKLVSESQQLVLDLDAANRQIAKFRNIISHNCRGPIVSLKFLVDVAAECRDVQELKDLLNQAKLPLEEMLAKMDDYFEV